MQTLASDALMLDVVDLQERDRIITFLTAEHGKRRGVAQGAKAKYSRFSGQLQPLAKVRVSWFEKPGRDLVRISEVELLRPAEGLNRDLEGILLGAYLAEHMKELALEGEESSRLFRLLDSTIESLLAGVSRDLAARYFEVWALRLSGLFALPTPCRDCGWLLDTGAEMVRDLAPSTCPRCDELASPPPAAGWPAGPAALMTFLLRSGRQKLGDLAVDPPPGPVLRQVEALCRSIRREFLQKELNSYGVMHQTLQQL